MINKNQRCEMVLLLKPLQNINILIVQIVLMVLIFDKFGNLSNLKYSNIQLLFSVFFETFWTLPI